jgi:hypothetical protein
MFSPGQRSLMLHFNFYSRKRNKGVGSLCFGQKKDHDDPSFLSSEPTKKRLRSITRASDMIQDVYHRTRLRTGHHRQHSRADWGEVCNNDQSPHGMRQPLLFAPQCFIKDA